MHPPGVHLPPRALAQRYVEEGLRMDEHPLTPGGAGHFGMIFMPGTYRRTRAGTGRIIAALEVIFVRYPGKEGLLNAEAWL